MRGAHGFSLIELVLVMVVLGVLATGTVSYIVGSMESYVDTARRDQLVAEGRMAVERIARELRTAHPSSIRFSPANAACLEFLPILGSGSYNVQGTAGTNALPVANKSADKFDTYALTVVPVAGQWVIVGARDPYTAGNPASRATVTSTSTTGGVTTIILDGQYTFETSPARRVYVAGGPVAFCIAGNELRRYSSYTIGANPNTGTGTLLAQELGAGSNMTVNGAALGRNSLVQAALILSRDDESVTLRHEIQVRNVP